MQLDPVSGWILNEVDRATPQEANAYLLGAVHDGYFNRLHKTVRIAQADPRWLGLLQSLFRAVGCRSWIYREGSRNVWVVDSSYQLRKHVSFPTEIEMIAFVRGYFDAEGGIPKSPDARFYVQFVQRDLEDPHTLRNLLMALGIQCGSLHNPSVRIDPDYWRFYVLSPSHVEFIRRIGSWHPRKRLLLKERIPKT